MVIGAKRWDGAIVGEYLRTQNPPGKLVLAALANLLSDSSPTGLVLKMHGQGNAHTSFESYIEYVETLAINEFLEKYNENGISKESLIYDAAEHFQLSEATIRRRIRSYESIKGTELDVPVSSLNP